MGWGDSGGGDWNARCCGWPHTQLRKVTGCGGNLLTASTSPARSSHGLHVVRPCCGAYCPLPIPKVFPAVVWAICPGPLPGLPPPFRAFPPHLHS